MTARRDREAARAPGLAAIFRAFAIVGTTSIGGGGSAHVRRLVVDQRAWLDEARFHEALTLARTLPGPNVSNLAAFVGATLRGPAGAIAALAGVALPGIAVVLAVAAAYTRFVGAPGATVSSASIDGGLHGLAAGATGIMAELAFATAKERLRSGGAILFAVLAFALVGLFRVEMAWVVAVLVPLAAIALAARPKGAA
jgi:chromate transporter